MTKLMPEKSCPSTTGHAHRIGAGVSWICGFFGWLLLRIVPMKFIAIFHHQLGDRCFLELLPSIWSANPRFAKNPFSQATVQTKATAKVASPAKAEAKALWEWWLFWKGPNNFESTVLQVFGCIHVQFIMVYTLEQWDENGLFRVYGGLYYPLMQGLQILDELPSLKPTARAPKSGWLENQFPFEMAYFQGRNASFREGRLSKWYVLVLKPVVLLGDNGNGWFKFTWLDYINTKETRPKHLWEISNWDGSHSLFKTMLSRILQTWDMTLDEKDKRIKGSSKDDAYQTMSK